MNYQEWLDNIQKLEQNQNDVKILEKLENEEINNDIQEMLTPKLQILITNKTNYIISNFIKEREIMYSDINHLDYSLVKFKKDVSYIYRLINLKQIPINEQNYIKKKFKEDIKETYNILKKEADVIDYTGAFSQTIANNEYKWSD